MNIPAEPEPLYDGKDVSELSNGTKLISLSVKDDRGKNKPMVNPVYHTTMYHAVSCEGFVDQMVTGYGYNRVRNPNTDEVEMTIAQIEKGKGSLIFPSGMAAISNTLLCFLKPGDHVVAQAPLYSCTSYILKNFLTQFNVGVSYVDSAKDADVYREAIQDNTVILYGETLCNPMMHFLDMKKFADIGKEKNILTVVDATFTPPTNHAPLNLGIDIVMHSASKYINGHSDMLAGCVTMNNLENYERLRNWRAFIGSSQSAFDTVMLMRSLRTLQVRTDRHNENGMAVANYLQRHPLVKKVHYIGLESHPQHSLAAKHMKGFGGMMSIELESREKAIKFAESTKVFRLAVSLGGVESLIEHPGTMTHNKLVSTEEGAKGIPDTMVRLSIGIESSVDQIADLEQALNQSEL